MAQTAGSGITSLARLPRGFSRRRARRASRTEDLRRRAVRVGSGGKPCHLLDVDGWIARFGEDECHRLEAVAPPHDWWDWYAAYMDARERGDTQDEASAAAGRYMADVKHVVRAASPAT